MTIIRAFIKRHPLLSIYALAFAIGWGGILILAGGSGGIPTNSERFEMLMPWVMVLWFAGPSIAGIVWYPRPKDSSYRCPSGRAWTC